MADLYKIEQELKRDFGEEFESKKKRFEQLIKEKEIAEQEEKWIEKQYKYFKDNSCINPISDNFNIYPEGAYQNMQSRFANQVRDDMDTEEKIELIRRIEIEELEILKSDVEDLLKEVNRQINYVKD